MDDKHDDDDDQPGGGTLIMGPAGPESAPAPTGHGTTRIPVVGAQQHHGKLLNMGVRPLPSIKSTQLQGFAVPTLDPTAAAAPPPPGPGVPAAVRPRTARQPYVPTSLPEARPSHAQVVIMQPQAPPSQPQAPPSQPHALPSVEAPPAAHHAQLGAAPLLDDGALDEARAPSGSNRGLVAMAIGAIGAMGIITGIVVIVLLTRSSSPSEAPSASAAGEVESVAPVPAPASAPIATSAAPALAASGSASAEVLSGPDAEAVAALERLRDGLAQCATETTHRLPGTSPAVPASIAWLKSGPYVSSHRDWATPFFHCTRFKVTSPMPYQLQWQVDVPGVRGTGIAWLDGNRDGVADRAYAFTGTLKKKSVMEFGPIERVDATRKPMRR